MGLHRVPARSNQSMEHNGSPAEASLLNSYSRPSRVAGATRSSWLANRRVRTRIAHIIAYTIILCGAGIVSFPFFWQISTSLKSPSDIFQWPPVWIPLPPQVQNYWELATVVPLMLYIRNSVVISGLVVIGTLVSCSSAAYGFSRLRFPGRDLIFLVLVSSMIIPPAVTIVPQFVFFRWLGWYNTFYPLIVPAFFGNAFFIFLLRQFFLGISPELEDAARIDGAGYLGTFVRIIVPLSKPALATVGIFTFMWTWNDFFGPVIYLSDDRFFTLPLGLVFFQGSPRSATQVHLLMAMSVIIAAPCVVLYFFAQRMFIQGIVFTGLKG